MWIVTCSINTYDQYGEYFIAAYTQKPDFHQLKKLLGHEETDVTIGKLTRGGGRQQYEHQWYDLVEVQEGEPYQIIDVDEES